MDGSLEGTVLPDVPFTAVDGGVWTPSLGLTEGPTMSGGVSVVFAGDQAISLISRGNPEDRDAAADLLALSHQLAASLGLTLDPARG